MQGEVFQRRIVIGAGFCVAAFVLVGLRLIDVTLMHRAGPAGFSDHAAIARADLTDRNGELLARDLPVKDLYARPHVFWDKDQAAHDLAQATGADEKRLRAGFDNAKHPYVLVARQLTPDAEARVMHLGLPGLEFEASAKRYYPDGRAAAQILGVTDPDNNGVSGLELGLQDQLHEAAANDSEASVATSIDMRVQYILTAETQAARDMFSAHAAGGIVMDVNTGEIVAMTSVPDFDPNERRLAGGDSTRNIMAQDTYELGSVFKVFTFALGLEDHTFGLDEMFKIGTGYTIGRNTIHEAEEDHMPPMLAGRDVLARSSNIGSLQIALRSGGVRQKAFLANLGLLKPVHGELPETARPLYPSNWGEIQTATIGFGHGISVSPLSYVTAAAEVVNGGRRITPTFIRQAPGTDNRGEQVIKPQTSDQMRDLLRYVVTDGTGKKADVVGYDVGGKTGSAQVPGPNGHYIAHALRTSFFAVFPVHHPRYILFVLLDQPHGTKATGGLALAGYTAAPLAGRVISRIAPLLGVPNVAPPVQLAKGSS
jgi:cell division protein FtsI (penicillin-binding protein 3)